MSAVGSAQRVRVRVRGLVQGVGYRPFVRALAERHAVSGWVENDAQGVLLEVEGAGVPSFLGALGREAPPHARVESVEPEPLPPAGGPPAFEVRESPSAGRAATQIGVDLATCRACLDELFDPADRRFGYPFLSCSDCGPRHTIARAVPYDRERTAMASFPPCAACAAEQRDPRDRRFHAQAVACPACGPRLSVDVGEIARCLSGGGIVALPGLGGYHLACDARDEGAVAALRLRKERDDKPFAVLVASAAAAARWAAVSEVERRALEGPRRPILLCDARPGAGLAPSVAPGLSTLGVLLPVAPLHHLLLHALAGGGGGRAAEAALAEVALVLTSANPGGAPTIRDGATARARLEGIADLVVTFDREIVARSDDSVARVVAGRPRLLRRARGWAPEPIRLPRAADGVLAVGAGLKNAVCLVRGDRAHLSPHVGDVDDRETLAALEEGASHLERTLGVSPRLVVHDLHPDLLSTTWAEATGLPTLGVQHHHAHVAATLAEHGREGPALGLALDGFGLGADGGAWGGELLLVHGASFERVGHLSELPLAGLDRAAREPWRMAVGALVRLGRAGEAISRFGVRARPLIEMIERGVRSPPTSSAGRWFDAAAALLGVADRATYEGEAAMRLEARARRPREIPGLCDPSQADLDLLPLLGAIADLPVDEGADLFHGTLAAALARWAAHHAARRGLAVVALGGGCFANRALTEGVAAGLEAAGLEVLVPADVPAGDGGIALGQALVGACHLAGAPGGG